jgi:transcription elongation GreA/GreB family factor
MVEKQLIHQLLKQELENRISSLKLILAQSFEAVASEDTKSSAGDKHETSVSMAQLEQEKLTRQINQLLELEQQFFKIKADTIHSKIQFGSLIETNNGFLYVSIGLGKVSNEKYDFYALGPEAPLVKLMIGKKTGDCVEFNGNKTEILQVF